MANKKSLIFKVFSHIAVFVGVCAWPNNLLKSLVFSAVFVDALLPLGGADFLNKKSECALTARDLKNAAFYGYRKRSDSTVKVIS